MASQITEPPKRRSILLVEDDPAQALLVMETFKRTGFTVDVSHASSGQEALAMLCNGGGGAAGYQPDLVLLDVHMPGMSGFDVMRALSDAAKSATALQSLVTIAFSSSDQPEDIRRMYELGCRSYVRKPFSYTELLFRLRHLCTFWFDVAVLPARS